MVGGKVTDTEPEYAAVVISQDAEQQVLGSTGFTANISFERELDGATIDTKWKELLA